MEKIKKIVKRYKISYVCGGTRQYAEFYEGEDGHLYRPKFRPNWAKAQNVPDVSSMTAIEDVLNAIDTFSARGAFIISINDMPLAYESNSQAREITRASHRAISTLIQKESKAFFKAVVQPFLDKQKWFIGMSWVGRLVLMEKDEVGKWQNVKNSEAAFELGYICHKFAAPYSGSKADILNRTTDGFYHWACLTGIDYLEEQGYYIPTN